MSSLDDMPFLGLQEIKPRLPVTDDNDDDDNDDDDDDDGDDHVTALIILSRYDTQVHISGCRD